MEGVPHAEGAHGDGDDQVRRRGMKRRGSGRWREVGGRGRGRRRGRRRRSGRRGEVGGGGKWEEEGKWEGRAGGGGAGGRKEEEEEGQQEEGRGKLED